MAADPSLMFEEAEIIKGGEKICPLVYAMKTRDIEMLKLFSMSIIKKDDATLTARYKQAFQQPITHIDLKPLFDAYELYIQQCGLWLKHQLSNKEIDTACLELGKVQGKYLPMSMLKVFCDEKTDWSGTSKFVIDDHSRRNGPCEIRASYRNKGMKIEILNVERCGQDFGLLIREMWSHAVAVGVGGELLTTALGSAPSYDLATFRRLVEVRDAQFSVLRQDPLNLTSFVSQSSNSNVM